MKIVYHAKKSTLPCVQRITFCCEAMAELVLKAKIEVKTWRSAPVTLNCATLYYCPFCGCKIDKETEVEEK